MFIHKVLPLLAIAVPTAFASAIMDLEVDDVFCVCDANKDGSLALTEATQGNCTVAMNYFFGQAISSSDFTALDTDNGGTVSKDEFSIIKTALNLAVAVSAGNFGAGQTIPDDVLKMGVEYFECICDANGDKKVTWAELEAKKCKDSGDFATGGHHFDQSLFQDLAMDQDQDGAIEIDEFMKEVQKRYKEGWPTTEDEE